MQRATRRLRRDFKVRSEYQHHVGSLLYAGGRRGVEPLWPQRLQDASVSGQQFVHHRLAQRQNRQSAVSQGNDSSSRSGTPIVAMSPVRHGCRSGIFPTCRLVVPGASFSFGAPNTAIHPKLWEIVFSLQNTEWVHRTASFSPPPPPPPPPGPPPPRRPRRTAAPPPPPPPPPLEASRPLPAGFCVQVSGRVSKVTLPCSCLTVAPTPRG